MRFVMFLSAAFLIFGIAHGQTCTQGTAAATIIACTAKIAADQANKAQLFNDYLERSTAEQTEKQYAQSIADAKTAIALNRRDATGYKRLVSAYQAAGEPDQAAVAEGQVEKAGSLDFDNPNLPRYKTKQDKYEALVVRAGDENALGLWDAAMADENTAIALLPNNSWAYEYRAITYDNQGNFGPALTNLNKAIALAPTDVRPLYDRIRLYEFERRYADAARDETVWLRLLTADGPDNAPGPNEYNIHCWDQAHTLNLIEALSDCQKAIALLKTSYGFDPANHKYELLTKSKTAANIYDSTGYVYLKLKRPTQAIYNYSTALSLYPKFASSLYGRALAEQALGQTQAATADFTAAKTIAPNITKNFGT